MNEIKESTTTQHSYETNADEHTYCPAKTNQLTFNTYAASRTDATDGLLNFSL